MKYFRGNELQSFFTKMLEENMKALIKVQYVDSVAKSAQVAKAIVGPTLKKRDAKNLYEHAVDQLELTSVLSREVGQLSGGELQRFIIGLTCVQLADIYMFDEPSSYLDVKQRLNAARMIRSMLRHDNYVICVEHDLSILDYLSDFVCCLYGTPGAYGVVTMPFSVREGINIFLAGFVPTENLRFRDDELTFRQSADADNIDLKKNESLKGKTEKEKEALKKHVWSYPRMEKTLGPFHLVVEEGIFGASETVVMLGQNGTGKTTMIKMLAGLMKCDDASIQIPALNVSYKP